MAIPPVQGQANPLPPTTGSPLKSGGVPVPTTSTAAPRGPTPRKEGTAQPAPREGARPNSDPHPRTAAAPELEVHLRVLPDAGATILQFVDPRTNRVVREFPAEDLVRALAAIRAGTGARLDETA